ncbi:hypothetical protein [uncultured Brachyspira sp.]|uniref:hypothetical protein n=1 Tax=uncultured Brachyspira sp. TaxID=221953 RepID=UPI0025FD1B16|nr:hypothetical protein [uncultured Brachyspira sp.]
MIVDFKKYVLSDLSQISQYIDDIKNMKLNIIIINEDNILSFIPYDKIEEVLSALKNTEYIKNLRFYADKSLVQIMEKQVVIDLNKQRADINDINIFYSFFKNCKFNIDNEYYHYHFDKIISMRNKERINYLKEQFNKLKEFQALNKINTKLAKLIGDILTDIGIIEKIDFLYHLNYIKNNNIQNLKNYGNVKKDDHIFADIIGTIVDILEKEYETNNIYDNIASFSDDNIISHSNRVFIMMVEFLYYYNKEVSRGVASKLRADYDKKYYDFYDKLGNKYNLLGSGKIETYSKAGLRKIERNEIKYYARAALLHDVALGVQLTNIPIISNNEGDAHSILGFNFLKYCIAQNQCIYTTVGLHHEYFGEGYGIFTNMYNKRFQNKNVNNIKNILTYDPNDINALIALSYFPAKCLEIADSYDSLYIDASKKINENIANSVIKYMYDNFLAYSTKLDPIIFYIFVKYLENVRNASIYDCPL